MFMRKVINRKVNKRKNFAKIIATGALFMVLMTGMKSSAEDVYDKNMATVKQEAIQTFEKNGSELLLAEKLSYVNEANYGSETNYYIVTASKLNVRESGDIKSRIVGTYLRDTLIEVLSKNEQWYQTDKGYVHKDYLMVKPRHDNRDIETSVNNPTVSRGGFIERPRINRTLNINEKSYVTVDQLSGLVQGTGLDGTAQAFYDIEQNHNVNAIFALAVARLESGNGKSGLARNKNNIFGFNTSRGFSSKSDCVYYFGDYINRKYFSRGITTAQGIQPIYCPPNTGWDESVYAIMQRDLNKLD